MTESWKPLPPVCAEEAHFSHLADYDEIAGNSCNLSVSTYVEQEDKREKIDIVKLNAKIETIVASEQLLRNEIVNSCVHNLTWTHFRSSSRVSDEDARVWYMSEAAHENWNVWTLDCSISTQYI